MAGTQFKPCPFCGSLKIKFEADGDGHGWGCCKNCGAHGPHENKRQSEDDPSWNTRVDH